MIRPWLGLLLLAGCSSAPEHLRIVDAQGRARVELTRVNGLKEGSVHVHSADGQRHTSGRFHRDSREGVWVTTGPEGDTVEMLCFHEGIKDGWQAYWSEKGRLLRVEHFAYGVADGPLYRFFADGSAREGSHYRNGVLDGPYMEWFKADSLSNALIIGGYHQDLRNGWWSSYFNNGRKNAEGRYVDNARVGLWRHWDRAGRERPREEYVNGALVRKVPVP